MWIKFNTGDAFASGRFFLKNQKIKVMIYDVDFFINKFEAIPEWLWLIGDIGRYGGPRCANGHCMGKDSDERRTEETKALCEIFQPIVITEITWGVIPSGPHFCDDFGRYSFKADRINNGVVAEYQQSTPKQRILAALYDIKAKQSPIYIDITKELAILPINETADQPIKILQ